MLNLLRITVFLIALLPVVVVAQEQKLLIDSDEQSPAQNGHVQVSGVVTFVEPNWPILVIQDGEHFVRVGIRSEVELPESLKIGDKVRVDGRTDSEADIQHVAARSIVRAGTGKLPDPVPLSHEAAISRQSEDRFVECQGVVFRADTDGDYDHLSIATPQMALKLYVRLSDSSAAGVTGWLGQTVRVRGVVRYPPDEECVARILSSTALLERVPSTEDGINAGSNFQMIGTLLDSSLDSAVASTIVGQAITDSRSSDLLLRDRTGLVLINGDDLPETRVGDIVVATGRVTGTTKNDIPVLTGNVQQVGVGTKVEAVRALPREAVDRAFEYITVTAEFRGFVKRNENRIPVLRDADAIFTVSGVPESVAVFNELSDRSSVQVTGVCWPKVGGAYDFELLADQVVVVYEPPSSVLDGLEPAGPSVPPQAGPVLLPGPPWGVVPGAAAPFVIGGVSLLLLIVLVAFLVLLRRTREQRKFYGAIHEQLNEVSHVARLNTLAEMVGALAHELNQPLTVVSNTAETAKLLNNRSSDHSPQFDSLLDRISSESLRAGEIIRRLRSLVLRKTPGQISTSMNQVVRDALDMFRMQELVANGTLEVQLDENLPDVEIDPIQFQQVILNFLLNARDATSALDGRLPKVIVRTARDHDQLTVSVEDNGPGISSSDPQAVFEPYFTTKEDGMGLGLAISRTIVESHNGTVLAENIEPNGARLTICLPIELVGKLDAA